MCRSLTVQIAYGLYISVHKYERQAVSRQGVWERDPPFAQLAADSSTCSLWPRSGSHCGSSAAIVMQRRPTIAHRSRCSAKIAPHERGRGRGCRFERASTRRVDLSDEPEVEKLTQDFPDILCELVARDPQLWQETPHEGLCVFALGERFPYQDANRGERDQLFPVGVDQDGPPRDHFCT